MNDDSGLAARLKAKPTWIAVASVVVIALVAVVLTRGDDDEVVSPDDDEPVTALSGEGPIRIRLSPGQAGPDAELAATVVDGEAIEAGRLSQIFARLSALPANDDDAQAYNRPAETLPPPVVGDTIDVPFGGEPPEPPPGPADGPLEVLRVQPDGAVDVAPFMSVTFNQPMIPLATLEQLDEQDIPVTMAPELPGRWRWIGTRTLRFEHTSDVIDRLPMATNYTVTIPAGTTSETGGTLDDEVTFDFETPTPKVLSLQPLSKSIDTKPVFVAVFDQRVDPAAIVGKVTLKAGGNRAVRLATEAEIAADEAARRVIDQGLDGRVVAFTPADRLPTDTAVEISFGEGTPSAEGPRTTDEAQDFDARTYGPFELVRAECGYDGNCPPEAGFILEFSNEIDRESFDQSLVTIDPAVGMQVANYGNSLQISAATAGNTTYEVTVSGDLRDIYGQRLGQDQKRKFDVGDARPMLRQFDQDLITTDPLADHPTISVQTINHDELRVEAYRSDPTDSAAFRRYIDRRYDDNAPTPPGEKVFDEVVATNAEDDTRTETIIDLTEPMGGPFGHLIVVVSSTQTFSRDSEDYWNNRPAVSWVQSTNIGVDAFASNDSFVVWTTDLRTGDPVADADVVIGSASATTDARGLATPTYRTNNGELQLAQVTKGDDTAILPVWWCCSNDQTDIARWFTFDDRGLYRPGEEVRVKGWVRRLDLSGDAQIVPVGDGATVAYSVQDSVGNEIGQGTSALSGQGGFDVSFGLPDGVNLGSAWVYFRLEGASVAGILTDYQHSFQVQEFRRPEFEVVADAESAGPHLFTGPVTVGAAANYFSGGPLSDAPVVWTVSQQSTQYAPPNWTDYTFGIWKPWWFAADRGFGGPVYDDFIDEPCCFPGDDSETARFDGRTDGAGNHFLQMDFEGANPDQPLTVQANAAVEDVNRQSFAGNVDLLVHSGSVYVGLAGTRTFVKEAEPLEIDAVLVDIDGNTVSGTSFEVTAARLETQFVDGTWTEVPVDPQTCTVTSADDAVRCTFDTDQGGTYRIESTVTDPQGGKNRTELTRWVQGSDAIPSRRVELEELTLVPDQRDYAPGDTASVLVQSPFATGTGLVTVLRNGVVSTETFELDNGSATVQVPITDALFPGVDVQVDVVGTAPRTLDDGSAAPDLPDRPAFATGRLSLDVPPRPRTLDVVATPRDDFVEPGGQTTVDLVVRDAGGAAVSGAEVAVVVVDEAVLSLTGYQLGDPLSSFYQRLSSDLWSQYGRQYIVLGRSDQLGSSEGAPTTTIALATTGAGGEFATADDSAEEGGQDGDGGADFAAPAPAAANRSAAAGGATSTGEPIAERTNFDALAVFAPDLVTGADGAASVPVQLPDNLTRYRVMAVAVDANRFGTGESTITAGLPLSVRPSAPRFLNFGDRFELPIVVQNRTDGPLTTEVAIEATNLTLTEAAGKVVTVPANDRVEVRFPAAAESAGTARFRAVVVSGDFADAATVELPVYTPTTTEAFATYGVVDDGAVAQPVQTPTGVVTQFGGLEVTTSSTALQALTDAVLYLQDYPYESSDAYASRIMAVAALYDVLDAFDVDELPSRAEMEATMKTDIGALVGLQNDDGGWSVWKRYRESVPYHSIQAAHALAVAKNAGIVTPDENLQRALGYLRDIENRYPSDYPEELRRSLSAYALHVRDLAGDRDPAKAAALYRQGELQLDAQAWLWPVLDDAGISSEIERNFANRVTETAGAATFTTDYGEDAYLILASDRRTDGIILDALIRKAPSSDLIPKVVTGLIGNQQKGRWNNVQENAFILLALKRYFDTFEATTPDFVARVWLGDEYAASHEYRGRSTDSRLSIIPMDELVAQDDPDLVIQKSGPGRLYYRLGLRYAPDDLSLDPRDEGFVVERTYEAVNDPSDVTRDADGTWRIEPGAEIRVSLTMIADSRRVNVALVDHLPAGLEIVNPDLAASPALPPVPEEVGVPEGDCFDCDYGGDVAFGRGISYFPWYGTWYEHQNLRDDRAEAFTAWLGAGTYEYSYVARATTPGTFVAPPPKAEEMYSPEVFGRGPTDTVTVG